MENLCSYVSAYVAELDPRLRAETVAGSGRDFPRNSKPGVGRGPRRISRIPETCEEVAFLCSVPASTIYTVADDFLSYRYLIRFLRRRDPATRRSASAGFSTFSTADRPRGTRLTRLRRLKLSAGLPLFLQFE